MAYKVYYSFLHKNEEPYLADGYKLYRQEVAGSTYGDFNHIKTLIPSGVGNPILITGVDEVEYCDTVLYNYKVSAYNEQGEVFGISPMLSGIKFNCPPDPSVTPTSTTTPTPTPTSSMLMSASVTPTNTITPTSTITPTATSSITPTSTITPTITTTPSITPTITITPSITPTITTTPSITPTSTITPSATSTITPTATVTSSVTPTSTITPTVTSSITPTSTITPTITQTITPTNSITPTSTITPTASVSPGASETPTPTTTTTPTTTSSITPTSTITPTATITSSVSPTSTITPTATSSITPTSTITPTATVTPTATSSPPSQADPEYSYIQLTGAGGGGVVALIDGGLDTQGSAFNSSKSNIAWPEGKTKFTILPADPMNIKSTAGCNGAHDDGYGWVYQGSDDPWPYLNMDNAADDKFTSAPDYFANPAGCTLSDFLLYDFGLMQKNNNGTFTQVKTITKDAHNQSIHLRVGLYSSDPVSTNYGTSSVPKMEIRFTGIWE